MKFTRGSLHSSVSWRRYFWILFAVFGSVFVNSTCRLLQQMNRTEAAVSGFRLAVRRAIDVGNLPLAIAAIGDLQTLGVDVEEAVDQIAEAFCEGSPRLQSGEAPPPPPLPHFEGFQPLSSFLTGPALTSKATPDPARRDEHVRRGARRAAAHRPDPALQRAVEGGAARARPGASR